VHFLVTQRALLESRASQIVQRRWSGSQRAVRGRRGPRQVGMTLQTDETRLRSRQHSRISRAVRLVACGARLGFDGRVLENKGPAFIRVALEAAGIVGINGLQHPARDGASMRVVAVHAGHSAFWEAVLERPLKAGPDVGMAFGALRINVGRLARNKVLRAASMDGVARRTAYLVPRMAAVDTAGVSRPVQVARQAELVVRTGFQLCGLNDVGGAHRLRMFAARPVARLACPVGFDLLMRIFLKRFEDIFMAALARGGAGVLCGLVGNCQGLGGGALLFLGTPHIG